MSQEVDNNVLDLVKQKWFYPYEYMSDFVSQKFDNNVLDIVKQKGFYPYDYMSDFEKFKEELPSKEKFCSS